MNTNTPRTDAGCAPIYFGDGTSTIAADPEISRQLERELNEANAQLAAYKEGLRVTQEMLSRICR